MAWVRITYVHIQKPNHLDRNSKRIKIRCNLYVAIKIHYQILICVTYLLFTYRKTSLLSRGLYKILQLFTAANQRVRPNIECGL